MNEASRPIPPEVLERRVQGTNLPGSTLAEALEPGPTLLVFLRHFG